VTSAALDAEEPRSALWATVKRPAARSPSLPTRTASFKGTAKREFLVTFAAGGFLSMLLIPNRSFEKKWN
jgi:hypothetical protein